MKKVISAILLLVMTLSLSAQKQTLTVKPGQVQANKKMVFTYTGTLNKEGLEVSAGLFSLKSANNQTIKTELKKNKVVWTMNIPDSVVYVIFKITNGSETDTNASRGYGFNVFKNGKAVPGTYALQGIFNLIGANYGVPKSADKCVELIEKEYAVNTVSKANSAINYWYLKSLSATNRKDEVQKKAQQMFDEALQRDTEDELIGEYIHNIYPGNESKSDSMLNLVAQRFPKGVISFRLRANALFNAEDPDKVLTMYDAMLKDFPAETKKLQNNIDRQLLIAYRKKKDYVNFEKFLANSNKELQAEQLNELGWELATSNSDLPAAKVYSERSLAKMDSLLKGGKTADYDSNEKWEESINKKYGNYYDTYGYILYKSGDKQSAAEQQKKAVELTLNKNTYINEQLVKYLIESNQPKEALIRAEKFKVAQQSTAKIDSMYTVAYIALNGSIKGLEVAKSKIMSQIKDAPDFTLKTLDGKSVTLSALKGKIVILDFWATWCGPCIRSFPGMQKAVNELKDNKDVCFFFINTFERVSPAERLEKIKSTVESKNVNFDILLDEQVGNDFVVSKLYGVKSIPTKIIIDKNGKIYTTLVGYSGNDEELVKELKSIVEAQK